MPTVDVVMERSLRRGFGGLMAASLRPVLDRRDITSQFNDVSTAFSSWDNCMNVTYCKWPVIALIIVGGLIIFSVIWCIIRCACCGRSCCCSCFSCLKCCGNCCGCCDPPRGSRAKYLDEPYIPPNQGYKSQAPMNTGIVPVQDYPRGPTIPAVEKTASPQYASYAEFDVSKKPAGSEDALPVMPSWEGAGSKKVMVEEEEVEMDQLNKKPETGGAESPPPLMTGAAAAGAAGAVGSAMAAVPGRGPSRSPDNRSPYGAPQRSNTNMSNGGYYSQGGPNDSPYGQDYRQSPDPYGRQGMTRSPGPMDQGYGVMAASAMGPGAVGGGMGPGRRSPPQRAYTDNGGYGQQQGQGPYGPPARQGSYDTYGRPGPGRGQQSMSPYDNQYDSQNQGYGSQGVGVGPGARGGYRGLAGPAPRHRSPPVAMQNGNYPANPMTRRSPGPAQNYGDSNRPYREAPPQELPGNNTDYSVAAARRSPAPQQYYNSTDDVAGGYDNRPYGPSRNFSSESSVPLRAPPQRQYTNDNGHDMRTTSPVPAQQGAAGGFDFNPSGYSRPTTANGSADNINDYNDQERQAAYPGYRPYQPAGASQQQQQRW